MIAIAERLADPSTTDETVAAWARAGEGAELEALARDEARLVRHPAIVAALFENSKAPMALVNRAVAACVRGGARAEGIPFFDEIAQEVLADEAAAAQASAPGAAFETALAASASAVAEPDAAAADETGPGDGDGDIQRVAEEAKKPPGRAPIIDFSKLKLFEKIRLATLGNALCRQTLLRDSNRLVAMAAIRSPGITETEVVRASGNRAVSEDVIRYIANKKDYVKIYPVKLSLVGNPKCPLALSLRLLAHLRSEDLKTIARSKNIPSALATAAKKLAAKRDPQ